MTVKEGKLVPRTSCRRERWKLDDFQQTTNIKIISTIKKISVVLMYCENLFNSTRKIRAAYIRGD